MRKVVMSGMRPTGNLHLGHYVGVLKNWVSLQADYRCYFMIADLHALTTKYDQTESMVENIYQMALDWLAAGVEPERATMYVQSAVPEIAELHLLLSMLTPNKWVETDPTLKDMVGMRTEGQDALTYGLLGYPILQTADILAMKGDLVPVGRDQLAHLEISRDIARRFNHVFSAEVFAEPRPLLTEVPLLQGLDGRKMGKSYGNGIYLAESDEETWAKIKKMAITDPGRIKRDDPGVPENCQAVYPYYQVFAPHAVVEAVATECRGATRGCVDCKKQLADVVNASLKMLRERRAVFAADRAQVEAILKAGNAVAREQATVTLQQVKSVMRLYQTA